MIRVSKQIGKNESTYIIHHGFVPILINKERPEDIYTICTNGIETNIINPNLNECNIVFIEYREEFLEYIKGLKDIYGDCFFIVEGNLYSDLNLANYIIRIKEGE